jgi:dihydrofolate synthase / folylpolyglutamate synthase
MGRFAGAAEVFASFEPYIDLERGTALEALKLDRMRALCESAGNPERSFKSIHIAGSKGKGSVSAMCASILREAGYRTGLYASPHVTDYRERITLAGALFEDGSYAIAAEEVHAAIAACLRADPAFSPSFFELLTLLAFLVFKREGCEWAVLETGLGGRLDSTNVVIPEASVILPIELEHTEYLGATIAAIAREKAGIIKPGKPVFLSRMRSEAALVLRERASELGSPVTDASLATAVIYAQPGFEGTDIEASIEKKDGGSFRLAFRLALIGRIQAENAALAALVLSRLLPSLDEATMARGLASARIPARFEPVRRSPLVVVDGSHTPDSVSCALNSWIALRGRGGTLVFACAADKDDSAMADVLAPSFDRVIVTKPGDFKKSAPLEAFASFSRHGMPLSYFEDPLEALSAALAAGEDVLATGSFYLAALVRKELLREIR